MVVNSTSFILTTYIPDWLLEEPSSQNQGHNEKAHSKLTPSIQKTRKRAKQKLLYSNTLFQPDTTEKSMSEPLLPSGASRVPSLPYCLLVRCFPAPHPLTPPLPGMYLRRLSSEGGLVTRNSNKETSNSVSVATMWGAQTSPTTWCKQAIFSSLWGGVGGDIVESQNFHHLPEACPPPPPPQWETQTPTRTGQEQQGGASLPYLNSIRGGLLNRGLK